MITTVKTQVITCDKCGLTYVGEPGQPLAEVRRLARSPLFGWRTAPLEDLCPAHGKR